MQYFTSELKSVLAKQNDYMLQFAVLNFKCSFKCN